MTFTKQAEAITLQVTDAAGKLNQSIQELVTQGIELEQRAVTAEARALDAEARADAAEEKLQMLYAVIEEASSSIGITNTPETSDKPAPTPCPSSEHLAQLAA
ncbi:hypothetical protein KUV75_07195 [Qipengyuania gaetbuli]|uniref:hypothetical protein n=1 Tax=Qipengyuania gaetbuli TaxID=266952 RepID=UPI001C99964D|nr:hypothetical protein [Qipengyuania gaetbuli]MBY6014684.1 hypothetical protein [Qipengyuania gaetbuli]